MEPISDEEKVQNLITHVVCSIVNTPAAVRVERDMENIVEDEVRFVVHCAPDDARFVIGKLGRNADAIRTIAWAASATLHMPKVLVYFDVPPLENSNNVATAE